LCAKRSAEGILESHLLNEPHCLGGLSIRRVGRQEAIDSVLEAAESKPIRVAWVYASCVNIARRENAYRAVNRAPWWIRRLRVEWAYRLWRRYLVGGPLFIAHVVSERLRRDIRS
jgi:UDP-N-acetyl-D-mannosaminuronic acid transferase (WecB/TagA/CpsF family)